MLIADCRMDGTWYAAGAHIPGRTPSNSGKLGALRSG
jgi:hypothetical protein